jgi:hypothetical protein
LSTSQNSTTHVIVVNPKLVNFTSKAVLIYSNFGKVDVNVFEQIITLILQIHPPTLPPIPVPNVPSKIFIFFHKEKDPQHYITVFTLSNPIYQEKPGFGIFGADLTYSKPVPSNNVSQKKKNIPLN